MRQSRLMSLVEAMANVVVGYAFAVGCRSWRSRCSACRRCCVRALGIGAIFTLVSLVRGYLLRRVFEAIARM